MKKFICCSLAILLVLSMFAGCGKEEAPVRDVPVKDFEAPAATEAATEAPTEAPRVEMSTTDLAEYVQKRTVTISVGLSNGTSTGSGFFIDDQGTVVTSYHVIDGAESIEVEVSDGGKYQVDQIVDFNENLDIAVLKLDISGNDYLKIAEEDARTGEEVYAVGSSLGFLNGTFSNGMVSTASRKIGIIDCVQTTAAISSGNSGGPLVNVYGEVIGINAFSYTSGENLNLAVKIHELDELAMDKNFSVNQFREWYKKEIDRSFYFYSYSDEEYYPSKVHTYQHVTGRACEFSAFNWEFLEGNYDYVVDGYDVDYGLFMYEYHVDEFDAYTDYLSSVGFEFKESEDFTEGTSYYYENEFMGYTVDIFVLAGDEVVIIEPYMD